MVATFRQREWKSLKHEHNVTDDDYLLEYLFEKYGVEEVNIVHNLTELPAMRITLTQCGPPYN